MKKITKNIFRTIICVLTLYALCFALISCSKDKTSDELWADALYTEDTQFGHGDKAVKVRVDALDKSVTFTLNTDEKTLADALLEHNLISGENGAYGIYIKSVNGIVADYDADQSFWSLQKSGEILSTGADGVEIADGDKYEMVYTR